MRVLVTGADGFVGGHLMETLCQAGDEAVAVGGPDSVLGETLDIFDHAAVDSLVARVVPDAIVHLAAVSSVASSHENPSSTITINVVGTTNLLQAVRRRAAQARVLLVGSGEVYGNVTSDTGASEDAPLIPSSPYAASKVAAECIGLQFHRSYGTQVIAVRPFNHIGPGQSPSFVVPSFARQVIQARDEGASEIRVGNLEPVRDFSHVADVVAAYHLLLRKGVAGEVYNVCSGQPRTIRSILDELMELANVHAKITVDPAKFRPSDLPVLVGSPVKLQQLGWSAKLGARRALQEALADAERTSGQAREAVNTEPR